ncbi:MAG: glycosyltransferase family 2 protein [Myxococcales bacterium]|nr:glycosyltransferase family 2 protein [Myxococcales bacterium]
MSAETGAIRDVLVVVLNYRVADLALDCVARLEPQIANQPGCSVVIVDNDSGDGSAERLAEAIEAKAWSSWARLVRSPRNGGFAFGNNVAIRPALAGPGPAPRYLWILNPDTTPRPGAGAALHDFLETHPEVGIAGSRLEDPDGTQHHSRYRFPTVWSELDACLGFGPVSRLLARWHIAPPLVDETHPIDWVAGASMMVRREVFEEVGLLDESFFMYFEEVDLCRRARRAGWPCWYVRESRVAHLAAQSSGVDARDRVRPRQPDYWFESRRRYWLKNHGALYAAAVDLAAIVGVALARLRTRLGGRRDPHPEHYLGDLIRHSVFRRGTAVRRIEEGAGLDSTRRPGDPGARAEVLQRAPGVAEEAPGTTRPMEE